MHVQEREELDYYPESAANNCFQEARIAMHEHNNNVQRKIDAAVNAGLFVVVSYFPWHCRATDAIVGEGIGIVGRYRTRAEADSIEYSDDEARWAVLPLV